MLNVTTNQIHKYAPHSPFFAGWLKARKSLLEEFLDGLWKHDFSKIGRLIEHDTMALHGVSLTGRLDSPDILWEPDTLRIMKLIQNLRSKGADAYFSIDTGPSVVILTQKKQSAQVLLALQDLNLTYPILTGSLGGESQIISEDHRLAKFLLKDIKIFDVN